MTQQKLKRLSKAILEIYRPMSMAELPRHFVSAMRGILPAEQLAYNDFNPQTGEVAITWDQEPPASLVKLLPAFEEHMLENPLVPKLFSTGPGLSATRITDLVSLRSYQKTHVYNEFYRHIGGNFQMGCGVSTKKSRFCALALNRERRNFTDEDIFILNVLRDHIQHALDISSAHQSAVDSIFSIMERIQRTGNHILCFNGGYRVTFVSKTAENLASSLFGCRPIVSHLLPAVLKELVVKLRGNESSEIAAPRALLTFTQEDGSSVQLRLAYDPENLNHCLIFELEHFLTKPEQLRRLGLSSRETEIAFWSFHRKTSWEIGKILHISPRTVEKHLENIFLKLRINNRDDLVTKAGQVCDI